MRAFARSWSVKLKVPEHKVTADQIRAAVAAAWKKVTPEVCQKISKRVRKNMLKVIELNGGNFYDE